MNESGAENYRENPNVRKIKRVSLDEERKNFKLQIQKNSRSGEIDEYS